MLGGHKDHNYSLLSIPAMWGLTYLPHVYAISLGRSRFRMANPRLLMAEIMSKPNKSSVERKMIRAESCQVNGFENLGLFAAAVLAGNFARLPHGELNKLTLAYILSRAVFNL